MNGEPAEQWQYDGHGWLTEISHLSEGHRVAVHYGYDDKGRLTGERQTVENPETGNCCGSMRRNTPTTNRGWQTASRRTACRRWSG
ncbi:RHS repeat protein [Escherichia coli]|nr:RHS repeat protein [Escherichia coli]